MVPLGHSLMPHMHGWPYAQDDLALLFVDMRSTLLVRMAAAATVIEELCLRTETFEQVPMVYGNPGDLVVCAPQVPTISMCFRVPSEAAADAWESLQGRLRWVLTPVFSVMRFWDRLLKTFRVKLSRVGDNEDHQSVPCGAVRFMGMLFIVDEILRLLVLGARRTRG